MGNKTLGMDGASRNKSLSVQDDVSLNVTRSTRNIGSKRQALCLGRDDQPIHEKINSLDPCSRTDCPPDSVSKQPSIGRTKGDNIFHGKEDQTSASKETKEQRTEANLTTTTISGSLPKTKRSSKSIGVHGKDWKDWDASQTLAIISKAYSKTGPWIGELIEREGGLLAQTNRERTKRASNNKTLAQSHSHLDHKASHLKIKHTSESVNRNQFIEDAHKIITGLAGLEAERNLKCRIEFLQALVQHIEDNKESERSQFSFFTTFVREYYESRGGEIPEELDQLAGNGTEVRI